jgi:hypothetical protein
MLVKLSDAQCGITLGSCLRWGLTRPSSPVKRAYQLLAYPLAYLLATRRESYSTPPPFRRKGAVTERIMELRRPLAEIAEGRGISIDRERLSERGRELFFGDITDLSHREYRARSVEAE